MLKFTVMDLEHELFSARNGGAIEYHGFMGASQQALGPSVAGGLQGEH